MSWELWARDQADSVAAAVTQALDAVAIPYFELFADEAQLELGLVRGAPPAFAGARAVEWLLWRDRREIAERHIQTLLGADDIARRAFFRAVKCYEQCGLDEGRAEPAPNVHDPKAMAFLAVGHSLSRMSSG
jgi:hypothetical protein